MMRIQRFELGPMANFIYILSSEGKAAIVDPAWDVPFLIQSLAEQGLELEMVLLTHGHHDHVNGLQELLLYKELPVYLSAEEAPQLTPDVPGLRRIHDGDRIELGSEVVECIHTPGHSPGGICYKMGKDLITGDTLFVGACGRTDLPGGDTATLYESLARLKALPDETVIYPGHGYGAEATSTIGEQKRSNPFLSVDTEAVFARKRNGF